jgi:hypothetical protein
MAFSLILPISQNHPANFAFLSYGKRKKYANRNWLEF